MWILTYVIALTMLDMQAYGEECRRCQPLLGDPFNNYLWYFYKVHHFTCPEEPDNTSTTNRINYNPKGGWWEPWEGDESDQIYCSYSMEIAMNWMEDQCSSWVYRKEQLKEKKHSEWIESCWGKNEVIGLPAPVGGTILALLFLSPVIFCACCCFFKRRGRKQTDPSQGRNPNGEEEQNEAESGFNITESSKHSLPQPPPGYNLVPLSEHPQQQAVPSGFKLVPLAELQQPQPPPGYNLVPLSELPQQQAVPSGFKLVPLAELQQPQPPPGYNLVPLSELPQQQAVPSGFKLVPLAELQQPQAPPGYNLIKTY